MPDRPKYADPAPICPDDDQVRFSKDVRAFVAEGLRDVANLAVGGMVFGQFLGERPFSVLVASAGVAIWMVLMSYAVFLRARKA